MSTSTRELVQGRLGGPVPYLVHREEVLEPDEKIFGEDIPAEMSSHRRTSWRLSELTGPPWVFVYGVRTCRFELKLRLLDKFYCTVKLRSPYSSWLTL